MIWPPIGVVCTFTIEFAAGVYRVWTSCFSGHAPRLMTAPEIAS